MASDYCIANHTSRIYFGVTIAVRITSPVPLNASSVVPISAPSPALSPWFEMCPLSSAPLLCSLESIFGHSLGPVDYLEPSCLQRAFRASLVTASQRIGLFNRSAIP